MWQILLVVSFCFILGMVVGYKQTYKKVPLVKFVNEDEKEKMLKEYDIELNETPICSVCGDKISLDNLGIVIPKKDKDKEEEITFVCSKRNCMIIVNV
jgi:hypothetical protein